MKLNHNKKSVKISLNLFALYAVMVCGIVFALPAFAASDPLVVVENLSTFIFSLIRAVGPGRPDHPRPADDVRAGDAGASGRQ